MDFILAIDQGSTHTRAAVADLEGRILGVGRSFGACHAYDGMERAMQAVRQAVASAREKAGLIKSPARLLFAGMTGADWPEEYHLLQSALLGLGESQQVRVVNDSIIALRGGTSRPYGVILIAGTGGNCAVRAPSGKEWIYHYYQEPDLQGGGALGTRALIAVFRSFTGRELETLLTPLVLAHYGLNTVDDLCRRYYAGRLERVSDLAPLVFRAASSGDSVAENILRSFGEGYVELAVAAMRRLGILDLEVEVVLSGSVFKGESPLLIHTIERGILAVAPRARLVNARYEPLVGAVILGLEALGVPLSETIHAHLEDSARSWELLRNVDG